MTFFIHRPTSSFFHVSKALGIGASSAVSRNDLYVLLVLIFPEDPPLLPTWVLVMDSHRLENIRRAPQLFTFFLLAFSFQRSIPSARICEGSPAVEVLKFSCAFYFLRASLSALDLSVRVS